MPFFSFDLQTFEYRPSLNKILHIASLAGQFVHGYQLYPQKLEAAKRQILRKDTLPAATIDYNVSVVAPSGPTHHFFNHNVRPDILDIGIFKNVSQPTHMEAISDLDYHLLTVILPFKEPPKPEPPEEKLIKGGQDIRTNLKDVSFSHTN